mmetsp:Transcript_61090/g.137658  ORF Transcript_61090/g.137658 Transcript_61090/m.137658 type:complete len:233 (+) Transcript_61090:237-935(+)
MPLHEARNPVSAASIRKFVAMTCIKGMWDQKKKLAMTVTPSRLEKARTSRANLRPSLTFCITGSFDAGRELSMTGTKRSTQNARKPKQVYATKALPTPRVCTRSPLTWLPNILAQLLPTVRSETTVPRRYWDLSTDSTSLRRAMRVVVSTVCASECTATNENIGSGPRTPARPSTPAAPVVTAASKYVRNNVDRRSRLSEMLPMQGPSSRHMYETAPIICTSSAECVAEFMT